MLHASLLLWQARLGLASWGGGGKESKPNARALGNPCSFCVCSHPVGSRKSRMSAQVGVRARHSCAVLSAWVGSQAWYLGLCLHIPPPCPSLLPPSAGHARCVGPSSLGSTVGQKVLTVIPGPFKAKDLCGHRGPSCHLDGAVAWRQWGICPGHLSRQVGSGPCCHGHQQDSQSVF